MNINKFKEISSGLFLFFILWGITLGPLVHCIDKVIKGQSLEPFRLGNVPIPTFQGAGATYLDVLILFLVAFVAVNIAILIRYNQLRNERDFKKKYGIKDDKSFADDLIEETLNDDDL